MLDLEQFRQWQMPYVYPLYSGYGLFDDDKYHPFFIINGVCFAISHTSNKISVSLQAKITGKYYSYTRKTSYVSVCNKPKKYFKNVAGYIYIKPLSEYLKKELNVNSVLDLQITSKKQ